MNYIIFNSRDQFLRLEIAKIVYFEADGNYTKIVMANKLSGILPLSIGNVEKALATQLKEEAALFIRVGKRFIVNRKFIYEVNTFKLPISKAALKNLKELLLHIRE